MPTIRVPPGVFIGEGPASTQVRCIDTNLIRWQNGNMKPVGGWDRITPEPFGSAPRNFHVWTDENNDRHAAYMCDDKVVREFEGVYYDMTPTGFISANSVTGMGYGSGLFGALDYGNDEEDRGSGLGNADPRKMIRFSMDNWASELIFSSSADGRVWVWDPITNAAPEVAAGAPTFVQAVLCTEEHHLMTLGQGGFPNRVAWSAQNDRTDWNFTDVTGSAGFIDLEGAGSIITGVKIPNGILVFTSTSVWVGRYVGAPYYYGFTKIANGCAPISAHSIASAGSKVYWMGPKGFWQYEGGVVSPLQSTLGAHIFDNIHPEAGRRKATAGFNGEYPEIWFFYPKNSDLNMLDAENTNYIVFCFDPGREWWAVGKLARTMFGSSTIDGQRPVGATANGDLFRHEVGFKDGSLPRLGQVYAVIGNIAFDDGEHNWQINQCQSNSAIQADATEFEFWGTNSRGGTYRLLDKRVPRPDGWIDTHFTAKDFNMRISGRIDAAWSLGAFNFGEPKRRGRV